MPLEPVQLPDRRSRSHAVYEWLRAAIVAGDLQPRERLVETTLAQLASVSRTPVREALQRLENDGFVRQGEAGVLEVYGFSVDELGELGAVREVLEGMATGLAASSRSPMELAALRHIAEEEHRLLAEDGDRAVVARVELNHAFHETIWGASRNRFLTSELRHLRNLIERLQDTTLRQHDRAKDAVTEHIAIIKAIEDRDSDFAERLAREHFRTAMVWRLATSRISSGVA